MTEDSLLKSQLDEYHLLSLLKGGGMARVYLGFDERLKRYLAVKIMHQPLRADPSYTRRFEQEARTIGQLEHPNIVRLYRYGNVNGLLYMAMQYIEGADLRTILDSYQREGKLLDPGDIAKLIRPIGLALDYAHNRGIVHRDVKPSNVLVNKDGQVFLADFGISLFTEFETRGEVFGTPHYIAPEQAISSDQAVAQSDFYSMGVMLYELFTGKLPFDAPEPLNIAQQHINQLPTPPRALQPELSPAVEAVILKALAKEPSACYATGAELADALDAALQLEANTLATLPLSTPLLARIAQLTHPVPEAVIAPAAYVGAAVPTQTLVQNTNPATVPRQRFSRAALAIGTAALLLLLALLAVFVWFPDRIRAGGSGATATAVAQSSASSMPTATGLSEAPPTLAPTPVLSATVRSKTPPTLAPISSPTATLALSPTGTATMGQAVTVTATANTTPTSAVTQDSPLATITVTVEPTPTIIAIATPTAAPAPSITPAQAPGEYTLLFAKDGDQSLVLVNTTAADFPLNKLVLRNQAGGMQGSEWGVTLLAPKACVAVQQSTGKAASPNLPCDAVGQHLVRHGNERFWRNDFDVYYNGQWVGVCQQAKAECVVTTTPKTRDNVVNPENQQKDKTKPDNGKKKGKKKDNGKGG